MSAATLFGYGAMTSGSSNPAGVGIGVRGGYSILGTVYVGGTVVDHFGDSTENILYFGGEAGYGLRGAQVLVRPYVGAGSVNVELKPEPCPAFDVTGCSPTETVTRRLGLWPGVTLSWLFHRFGQSNESGGLFIGGDIRFIVLGAPDPRLDGIGIFGTFGIRP